MTAYLKILPLILFHFLILNVSVGHSKDVKKHFYFVGGGGEPAGDKTQFDESLKRIGTLSTNPGWKVNVSFNGGHKNTESIISDKFKKGKNFGAFTKVNYNKVIDDMISKIKSKELGVKDQLMLVIETHGAERNSSVEKTHSIALSGGEVTDYKKLDGVETVNLDRLQELVNLAAKNGVKLAIADMSCFSGNLLNIKHENVCMISASGPNHYGYSGAFGFASKFYDQLKAGNNLESAFLNSRYIGSDPDFPMISTDEGQAVDSIIYKALSPYLIYNDDKTTDFTLKYDLEDMNKFKSEVCTYDKNHKDLMNLIGQVKDVYKITDTVANEKIKSLKTALTNYRNFQKKYESVLRSKFELENEIKGILQKDFSDKESAWQKYSPIDFLTMDYKQFIKDAEVRLKSNLDDSNKNLTVRNIAKFKEQEMIAKQLLNKLGPSAKTKAAEYANLMNKSKETWKLAQLVSFEARSLYDQLYKQMKSDAGNPCKDFVI